MGTQRDLSQSLRGLQRATAFLPRAFSTGHYNLRAEDNGVVSISKRRKTCDRNVQFPNSSPASNNESRPVVSLEDCRWTNPSGLLRGVQQRAKGKVSGG